MKTIFFAYLILFFAFVYLSGCSSTGFHASVNQTQVLLAKSNYTILAASVKGQASAEYLFGVSFGFGVYNQTFALIPLTPNRALYTLAMEDLWRKFEEKNGPVVGKKVALVNIRYDSEALNLLVYTKPRVTIVADVIEFHE